uniref:Histone deacetylase complex subunit SAP18 n=1 Tax=Strongyloides stercoralis TaxID=6248 RepID=A0A0K0E3Y9_STRER
MRSERIKEENRDRKEDNSGRKRRSDRIDSGNLVGKRSTRDGNYYGERSFRSKPSCHNSDECLRKNEKKKWDYNENKNSRRRRESSSTVYSESPVRERLFPRIDSYYQEILFCSKSSRHSSDKCLRENEKKNRDYNENKTSRRRRGFGAIDYENPVRKGSSTRDDNYYGKRSFCSKSSHRKSDKCLGKNEKKNRDYDENKTSRGNGFGTIDFENPVKKGSSTKKGNYYGKKLPRSDSSFHKSDKCLKRDEEKNENHKEDTRDDHGQSYKDITGEEKRSDSSDSGSLVKEKGVSEHDELNRNKKDTKNDDNCQYKDENPVEGIIPLQSIETSIEKASEESRDEDHSISILPKPATSSPQKEKTIVLSPKGIEYSTSNGSKNKKTTIQ